MKLSSAVALRISNILRERNMSQYRLEKNIDMPHNTMKTLMGERNSGVNLKTVMQIIRGLEMTTAQFFDDPIFENKDLEIYWALGEKVKTTEAVTKRILKLCEERNITPNKLGTISGVDPSTITSIFYKKSKNPGIVTIKELCDGLNITIFDFFNDELFKNKLDD